MLIRATAPFETFIDYLNSLKLCDEPCSITVLPGYDAIESPSGDKGWAVYQPEIKAIFVPAEMYIPEMTERDLLEAKYQCIAHEYVHHIQNINDMPFDELEAEREAIIYTKRFLCEEVSEEALSAMLPEQE